MTDFARSSRAVLLEAVCAESASDVTSLLPPLAAEPGEDFRRKSAKRDVADFLDRATQRAIAVLNKAGASNVRLDAVRTGDEEMLALAVTGRLGGEQMTIEVTVHLPGFRSSRKGSIVVDVVGGAFKTFDNAVDGREGVSKPAARKALRLIGNAL